MNRRNNGFYRPTMDDFFRGAAQCEDTSNLCSNKPFSFKYSNGKKITGTKYDFSSDSSDIPSNYFCYVDKSMEFVGIFVNDTKNSVHVFLQ